MFKARKGAFTWAEKGPVFSALTERFTTYGPETGAKKGHFISLLCKRKKKIRDSLKKSSEALNGAYVVSTLYNYALRA